MSIQLPNQFIMSVEARRHSTGSHRGLPTMVVAGPSKTAHSNNKAVTKADFYKSKPQELQYSHKVNKGKQLTKMSGKSVTETITVTNSMQAVKKETLKSKIPVANNQLFVIGEDLPVEEADDFTEIKYKGGKRNRENISQTSENNSVKQPDNKIHKIDLDSEIEDENHLTVISDDGETVNKSIKFENLIVFIKGINRPIIKQNPKTIQKDITDQFGNVTSIKISGDSYKIMCTNESQKQKLLANNFIVAEVRVQPSEPFRGFRGNTQRPVQVSQRKPLYERIIHGVPSAVPPEDLINSSGASHVVRLTKKLSDGQWANKMSVVLKYTEEHNIPDRVFLTEYVSFPVKMYTPEPIICSKCYKMGHTFKQCRNQVKSCQRCGKVHVETINCTVCCVNCKGAHLPNDKLCPKYQHIKQVRGIMAERGVSFHEAKRSLAAPIVLMNRAQPETSTPQPKPEPNRSTAIACQPWPVLPQRVNVSTDGAIQSTPVSSAGVDIAPAQISTGNITDVNIIAKITSITQLIVQMVLGCVNGQASTKLDSIMGLIRDAVHID